MERKLNNNQIKQIAIEYGKTKGATELAKEFKVSKQFIHYIICRLRKSGLNIPKIRDARYKGIVNELKKEHPELFK
jgi:transposase